MLNRPRLEAAFLKCTVGCHNYVQGKIDSLM